MEIKPMKGKMNSVERFGRFLYNVHEEAREDYCNKPKGKVKFDLLSDNRKQVYFRVAREAMSYMNCKRGRK